MRDNMVILKKFNELTNKELWEIAMLRTSVFALEQSITEEELETSDYNAVHYFVKKEDEIVAYARLIQINEKYYIGIVCTNINYRKLGFQKQIINKTIKTTNETNTLYVSSQIHIVDFYLKFGFKPIGDTYIDAGIIHQLLILEKYN